MIQSAHRVLRVDDDVYNFIYAQHQKNTHRSFNATLRELLGIDLPKTPARQLSLSNET